jgi:hypothetical protein
MPSDDRLLFESLTLFVDIAEATKKRKPGFLSKAWSQVSRQAGREYGDVAAGYEKVKTHIGKHEKQYGQAAKAVTAVALLAAGAYAYNRFLSKAGRKCSDYAGDDKTECMKAYVQKQFRIK